MSDAGLTPELALDYLGEMSVDIEAAVVLDASGNVAAATPVEGERRERLGALAGQLLERAAAADGGADQVEIAMADGAVFAVRGERWSIVVVTRRPALPSLMFYDLRSVIGDLGKGGS